MTEFDTGDLACYTIRMPGTLGPLLLSSLRRTGVRCLASSGTTWTVDMSVEDADLVDVAQKFDEYGVEIENVRELGR
jgi:hypothetical protein